MKNSIISLITASCALLSGFFPPAAGAQEHAAAAVAQQHPAVPRRGALYRVRHHGNTAYLFGTIHVGKPAFFPLESEVMDAMKRAGRLVLELDVRNGEAFQRALQKHGMYAAGDSIEHHLSRENLGLLRTSLEEFDLPFDRIRQMKPWLVANLLLALDLERNGYRRDDGVEFFLLSHAKDGAKTVQELESAEYQLALYDSMTPAEQEQYLRENLAQIGDGNALKKAQAMIEAWATANGKALEDMLRESLEDRTLSSRFMQRILLDKRNPEMASRIEALLRDDGTSFVGVGLLHLIGENGVPTLLRERGYEVEKLY